MQCIYYSERFNDRVVSPGEKKPLQLGRVTDLNFRPLFVLY